MLSLCVLSSNDYVEARTQHTPKTINSSNMDFNLLLNKHNELYSESHSCKGATTLSFRSPPHTVTVRNQFINHLINLLFTQKPDEIVLLVRFICL